MKCDRAQNLFSELVDQQLTAEVKADLLAHVADCNPCSEELVSFTSAHKALETLAQPVASAPVLSAVRERIVREGLSAGKAKPWYRTWWIAPAPALAAVGLMAVMVINTDPVSLQDPAQPTQVAMGSGEEVEPEAAPGNVANNPEPPAGVANAPASKVNSQTVPVRTTAVRQDRTSVRTASIERDGRRSFSPPSRTNLEDRRTLPIMTDSNEPKVVAEPVSRVVVAAYEAPSRYNGNEDVSLSDQELSQVSVTKTYASDGSVRRVRIFVEGASQASVENNETPTLHPQERSDNKHLPAWAGRV